MTETDGTIGGRSSVHATFVIERTYDAPPARVFEAWANEAAKTSWFGPADKPAGSYSLDFRVGGEERLMIEMPGGPIYRFDALYRDIVPGERIVYTYEMHRERDRLSVSVATVEIAPSGAGTSLRLTEQGVFLDGRDTPASREQGTIELMDGLGAQLQGAGERA